MRFLSTLLASVLGTLLALGAIFVFLILFVFALSLSADPTPSVASESVLKIDLSGPVPERAASDPLAQAFGEAPKFDLTDVNSALRKAAADDRIEGVWLRVRGAGSGWARLGDIRESIETFKESGKPVFASGTDAGINEQGLYLASAADHVFMPPLSPFQMNGFYITQPFFGNALERLDIEPKIVRVGDFKSAVEPFEREDLSEENELQLSELLASQNDQFNRGVGEGRGLGADEIQRIATENPILDSESALEAGLIDALRYPDEIEGFIEDELGVSGSLNTVPVHRYANVPASDAGLEVTAEGSVAVVYAEGNIVPGKSQDDPFGGTGASVGSETFVDAIDQARTSSDIQAIVVRVNSPGGSAAASEVMWRAIQRAADEKPVVISMGDLAASGGYYLAVGASDIVAQENTITGSIGVFGLLFNTGSFFENQLGVTFDGVETSPYADIYSGLKPFTGDQRERLEASLDRTYDTFLQRVADGRNMERADVEAVSAGRVWSGRDAKEVGLVDDIGGLSHAIERAAEAAEMGEGPYRIQILPRPKTFIERFSESFSASAHSQLMRWNTTPIEREWIEQQEALQRMIGTHGTIQARLPVDIRFE